MPETTIISGFGAIGDGKTINTEAIQAAVDACAEAGGGRVIVPAGTFVSGSILLKSNVEFHLSPGAVLRGSDDLGDYQLLNMEGHGYHVKDWLYAALLCSVSCENVSITGTGKIDGNGQVWWAAKDRLPDMAASLQMDDPFQGIRPPLLFFFDCSRVKVRDVKLMNSPMYTILPICSKDIIIDGVNIENPWMPYHNCDGIDIMSCKDVRISNCHVDTGDDGICLKTVPGWCMLCGPDENGEGYCDYTKPKIPCDNVLIENCVVRRAHSGVAIWAEVIGGMNNVVVTNCVFDGTRTGIQIARYPWIGGYVRNCSFSNIAMHRVATGIVISTVLPSYQSMDETGPAEERDTTPEFYNIRIANITGSNIHVACKLEGTEKNPVHDIDLSNIRMESDLGFTLSYTENIRMDAINLECQNVPLVIKDSKNIEALAFNARPSSDAIPAIEVENVRDAWIHGSTAASGTGIFLGEVGTENDVLLEGNRLKHAREERATVDPDNTWNTCSHAFNGSRWIRDSGNTNIWLPMPDAVAHFIRERWTQKDIDGIYSVSRVDANSRDGAEVNTDDSTNPAALHNVDQRELRHIYIIESWNIDERLVVFEDGEFLRSISDPDFHPHFEVRQKNCYSSN